MIKKANKENTQPNRSQDEISNSNSEIIAIKEQFYKEEDIAPEVQNILDEIFSEMVQDGQENLNVEKEISKKEEPNDVKNEISNSNSEIIAIKEQFYKEEDIAPEVQNILDEVFSEMVQDGQENINVEKDDSIPESVSEGDHVNLLEILENIGDDAYKHKIPLLKELILNYNKKFDDLEKEIKKHNENSIHIEEKKKEYEVSIKEFKERGKILEQSKNEFEDRANRLESSKEDFEEQSKKLQVAREQFMSLSKEVEVKKNELNKRESELNNIKRDLVKNKNELEKKKASITRNIQNQTEDKKEYALEVNDSAALCDLNPVYDEAFWETKQVNDMEKGKVEILQDILQNLLNQGNLQSCFLIDGQGLLISEYSKTKLDPMAIGAMFSLLCTSVLRTVKSLNLNALEYFKLSSENGEFILRNIKINNYERDFILIAYYNKDNLSLQQSNKKLNKKIIKNLLRHIKRDLYFIKKGQQLSWIFENLSERIDFLKDKYCTIEEI
jgi:predicted regulator of Ras-like GTPase activity (Roadblock/LC7/MglB family)/sulfur relay (sulfurtransferase) DsrC/TusE family protein